MSKNIYIILIGCILLFSINIQSQVTFGSSNVPLPGMLLQLKENENSFTNSIRGMALPQVALSDMFNLFPMFEANGLNYKIGSVSYNKIEEDAKHIGLMVYNTTHQPHSYIPIIRGLCFWTGRSWRCASNEMDNEQQVKELLLEVKASKIINKYDELNCAVYDILPGYNSPSAQISRTLSQDDPKEGTGAFCINYSFAGNPTDSNPESVSMQELWGDFRSDLSFCPLGISLWVKGKEGNKGSLRLMLLQEKDESLDESKRQYFQYTNKTIIGKEGWQQLVIPYNFFKLHKGLTEHDLLDLSCIIGYRIDVINEDNDVASGDFLIDGLEQLTSYNPTYGTPKFSSIFIQLDQVYQSDDWDSHFKACKEVGIDTWIIQYSHGYGNQNGVSWYSGTNAPWNETQYSIIDDMVEAAERQNFKLIFGLYGGDYSSTNLNDPAPYNLLYERNILVLDELYNKFSASPSFAGWYITEEFHDGTHPMGWHNDPARTLLAEYLQKVAVYAKSKTRKFPVTIAPALWRGMSAQKTSKWFQSIFEETPEIDNLYLQDVGGRCLTDVDVDLPNYFKHIKNACDQSNIHFGVDVESFLSCSCPDVPYRAKTWDELSLQLYVAGLYTQHITNFSWATFKPGLDSFEGYKKYLETTRKY